MRNIINYTCSLKMSILHRRISQSCHFMKNLKLKDTVALGLPSVYNSDQVEVESKWYEWWESQGYFQPEVQTNSKSPCFSIVLPPPNVTGTLHLGHALTNAIQDAIIRWHRMNGSQVLWVPGLDHAGIATQVVVEKVLWQKQQKTRHDIGREKFTEEILKWKNEKEEMIYSQLRRFGSTLDWSKKAFTMDPSIAEAVKEAFIRLHDEGLIIRRKSFINWCCNLQSTISDIEVNHEQISTPTKIRVPGYKNAIEFGLMTHFAYPIHDSKSKEEIVVATTRPETMFGDTAVAVNPADERYSHLHGQKIIHPFNGRLLPIICDEFVDMKEGTGAVKITPAQDPVDYQVALRHNLEIVEILDESGRLKNVPSEFEGLPRFMARESVLKAMNQMGLLKQQVPHSMILPVCSRSGDIIEHMLKNQWFIQCKEMANEAVKALDDGSLKIIPENFVKHWKNWLSSSKEWCISRQLAWGHRIPAYHAKIEGSETDKSVWVAARNEEEALSKASKKLSTIKENIIIFQDEDVLDTWFSSAIFPFAILGWPENTSTFKKFYPLSLMETGHDILTFWVIRIVMLGQKLTGCIPFSKILLHGIVCDAHGRKMSKSKGNVIDPLHLINGASLKDLQEQLQSFHADGIITKNELTMASNAQCKSYPQGIPKCGADALRFALCSFSIQSHTINFHIDTKLKPYRLFTNKIWQAARFILQNTPEIPNKSLHEVSDELLPMDKWILSRLGTLIENCNEAFSSYHLNHATNNLYKFIYDDFCAVYVEYVKPVLLSSDKKAAGVARVVVLNCFENALLALSPFMPFLCEELCQQLPIKKLYPSVCIAPYPQNKDWQSWKNNNLEETIETILDICKAIRNIKSDYGLKQKPDVNIICRDNLLYSLVKDFESTILTLSRPGSLTVTNSEAYYEPNKYIIDELNSSVTLAVLYKEKEDDHKRELSRLLKQELKIENELKNQSREADRSKSKIQRDKDKEETLTTRLEKMRKMRKNMERFSLNIN